MIYPGNGWDAHRGTVGRRARAALHLSGRYKGPGTPYTLSEFERFQRIDAVPDPDPGSSSDPSLHAGLQDLADMIVWDLSEACGVLSNPNLHYPGIDDGSIEPVSDEHIRLVIWASQREMRRERRALSGGFGEPKLPAVELAELPWRIQRAFAERRRLRFGEWGITRERWAEGSWYLEEVPDDDWCPPWFAA